MLQRLGRWLRTAGYDTEIINDGRKDYALVQQARSEDRLLLTCDQALAEYRDAEKYVVLLTMGSLDDLVYEVSQKCQIDWQFQPFTRCITCNASLEEADVTQRKLIPSDIKHEQISQVIYYCRACNKVYWDGGHVDRMRAQLEKWQKQYSK